MDQLPFILGSIGLVMSLGGLVPAIHRLLSKQVNRADVTRAIDAELQASNARPPVRRFNAPVHRTSVAFVSVHAQLRLRDNSWKQAPALPEARSVLQEAADLAAKSDSGSVRAGLEMLRALEADAHWVQSATVSERELLRRRMERAIKFLGGDQTKELKQERLPDPE